MAKKKTTKRKKTTRKKTARRGSSDRSLFDDPDSNDATGAGVTASSGGGNGHVVALHEATRTRYLNYALSVITSRALPDVRDGLKPVQRRILYTMWQQRLTHEAKHRKSAKVVGDVMGNYHPHGDSAIYDALVRMAQPWVMRVPLIDGSGNFGSIDADPPAAMRYTECRLQPVATELLTELTQKTVDYRPSYDGTREEPVVLPARLPNLLVNGSSGIAVGMATNIPPHNLSEVCNALLKLLADPEVKEYQLVANDAIHGPDFPTGGQILNTRDELREIYKTGSGSIRMRGTWEKGAVTRSGGKLYITSVPYGVNKAALVEQIGELVNARKLPLLLDVKDISTDDVRIELTLKKDADSQKVLAYLFKHTPLQGNFNVNLTCLIPTDRPDIAAPADKIGLKEILWHFLHFRLDVVTRRLEHELAALEKRIHILEGFRLVFDALDEIIRIIRRSDGKADAAKKIMAKFPPPEGLDAEQTDAILELKLYRLAKLEIKIILDELNDKQKRAREVKRLLKNEQSRWSIVESEIKEIQKTYGKPDKRRTIIEAVEDEPTFSADDFIVDEDAVVIVTRDGWVKRQQRVKDLSKTKLREGDSVLTAEFGSTRATAVFFSSFGTAYTCRIADIPATTGYGEPIQKLFKLKDGERIVAAFSLDPRNIGDIATDPKQPDYCPPVHAVAVSSDGYALRFGLDTFLEPSTRSGRKYARPKKGSDVIGVAAIEGDETIIAASHHARAILCPVEEINYLSGAGKGVILMKVAKDDHLLGFIASTGDRDLMRVTTSRGAEQTISTTKYEVTGRGGKGRQVMKTGRFTAVLPEEPSVPAVVE